VAAPSSLFIEECMQRHGGSRALPVFESARSHPRSAHVNRWTLGGLAQFIRRHHWLTNFCTANIIKKIKAAKFSKFQIWSHRGEVFGRGPDGMGLLGSERNSAISRCWRLLSTERRLDALASHAADETAAPTIQPR